MEDLTNTILKKMSPLSLRERARERGLNGVPTHTADEHNNAATTGQSEHIS